MRVWVDLATPPQVLFFRPIIAEIETRGHEVAITVRDFSQTVSLATQLGYRHTTIGRHGGDSVVGKGLGILGRAMGLAAFARGKGFSLAVSHNSYAQAVAAAIMRLPLVTLMDYEHQPANHIAFRLARKVIVPESFPDEALRRYGAPEHRVERFPGVKEDVYLADFVPDPGFLEGLGIPSEKIIVTLRPPATMALYHNFENPLFEKVVDCLMGNPDVFVVFLPRVPQQAEILAARARDNLLIPREAVDGPNLIYHSDLVISGGGTMNREAAVLGTPAYTVFKGEMAAVDRYLIEKGRLTLIDGPEDIAKIGIEKCKKARSQATIGGSRLLQEVVDTILQPG
jgi:predicted glycosyltransferase